MTISEAITMAAVRLAAHRVPDARRDAEVLLGHVLACDRAWIVAHYFDAIGDGPLGSYQRLLDRRAVREPLQYITGVREFWGLAFTVTPDVLIPRPETELVVESSLAVLAGAAAPLLIDLCTGSGCIAVSLAKELPEARLFATDRSEDALGIARRNARANGVGDRIRFLAGDLFGPLAERDILGSADLITVNPPYVRTGDRESLPPEVRDFEPELALFAGPKGTEIAERIIKAAPAYLKPGGALVLEIGIGQAPGLFEVIQRTGRYDAPDILKDLAGIGRVIVAIRK